MTVERDVVERLERAGVGYYVTGSEALSVWAEPRQTLDIGIVTDLGPERYDAVIRLDVHRSIRRDVGSRNAGGADPWRSVAIRRFSIDGSSKPA